MLKLNWEFEIFGNDEKWNCSSKRRHLKIFENIQNVLVYWYRVYGLKKNKIAFRKKGFVNLFCRYKKKYSILIMQITDMFLFQLLVFCFWAAKNSWLRFRALIYIWETQLQGCMVYWKMKNERQKAITRKVCSVKCQRKVFSSATGIRDSLIC